MKSNINKYMRKKEEEKLDNEKEEKERRWRIKLF